MIASTGFISNIKIGDSIFSTLVDHPLEVIDTRDNIEVACPDDLPMHLRHRVYPRKRPSLILEDDEIIPPGQNPIEQLRDSITQETQSALIPLERWTWHPIMGNLHVVLDYLEAGVNIMPIKLDGSKAPKGNWGKYHHTWVTQGAVETYFMVGSDEAPKGIGIALGPISGGLQMLECDMGGEMYPALLAKLDDALPGLTTKLNLRVRSGGNGTHIFFRCSVCPGSDGTIAKRLVGTKEDGKPDIKVLIEFRGAGSQAVAAGSPPCTHPSGKPYRVIGGDFAQIPVLTPDERSVLIEVARTFNEYDDPNPTKHDRQEGAGDYDPGDTDLPGTDFSLRGDWIFLEKAGYVIDKEDGKSTHWTRPGKNSGTSVTTDYMDAPILHCFSSSISELEAGANYTRFAAYAALIHSGDYTEAAKTLIELGYGKQGRLQEEKRRNNERLWDVFQKKHNHDDLVADDVLVGEVVVEPAHDQVGADEVQVDVVDDDPPCPLTSYLWERNHRFITDNDREIRMRSIAKVCELMPSRGFFPAYLRHHLPTSDCSVVFHLASALVMAGHLLNRRVSMEVGGSTFYPNLWVGLIAGSSTHRKSTAINCTKRLLNKDDSYSQTILSDSFTMESLISQLGFVLQPEKDADEKAKDGEPNFNPDGIPAWMGKRRFCQEEYLKSPTTFLKGAGIFHLNEIGGWLSTLTRSHNVSAKETITEWYDAPEEFRRETRSQGTYYIWKPCVSILGASTIQWLTANCNEADMMAGFLPRWLFFTSREVDYVLPVRDNPPDGSEEELAGWIDILQKHQRKGMELSHEAFHHYWKWRTDIGKKANTGIIGSWINRMADYAFKIAMIYEASVNERLREISLESMSLATALVDYLLVDLQGLLEELSFSKNEMAINKVFGVIKDSGKEGIGRSDLFKRTKLNKSELDLCLLTLAERETILEREVKTTGRKGIRYYAV